MNRITILLSHNFKTWKILTFGWRELKRHEILIPHFCGKQNPINLSNLNFMVFEKKNKLKSRDQNTLIPTYHIIIIIIMHEHFGHYITYLFSIFIPIKYQTLKIVIPNNYVPTN